MSSALVIEDLWKEYLIGGGPDRSETFYDVLSGFLRSPSRSLGRRFRRKREENRFWALREIELQVQSGEVLGIIGRNGAGKSTLLKVLSRITEPTRGRILVHGRLASLLEVGTGFHPELSGRENIFLNGAILGMTRQEIRGKLDEIVAFSEVEKFLETPVKRYSSGMYVRLAFAVAAHLDPDILVVDEVLAVGDASFQKKCLAKMGEVRGEGRTVLFVSHNMTAIQSLCTRAVWLDSGRIAQIGEPLRVMSDYLRVSSPVELRREWPDPDLAPGGETVRLAAVRIGARGEPNRFQFDLDTGLELTVDYWNLKPGSLLSPSFILHDQRGQAAFSALPVREPIWFSKPHPPGRYRSTCQIPPRLLNAGVYRLELLFLEDQSRAIFRDPSALSFVVDDVPEPGVGFHGEWMGSVRPALEWQTDRMSATVATEPAGGTSPAGVAGSGTD